MKTFLAVFIGGGVGSVLRYGIGALLALVYKGGFPIATLLANVLSCSILALVLTFLTKFPNGAIDWKALLVVGFCGGLSTFSTFSHESLQLIKNGYWGWTLLNIGSSLGLCILILYLLGGKVST